MAKLSARGRTQVARYERTVKDAKYGDWKCKYAFMSDGKVLKQITGTRWRVLHFKEGKGVRDLLAILKQNGAVLVSGSEQAILLDKK